MAERLLERFSIPGEQEMALLPSVAALEHPAAKWQRRFAERAAELGDQEALGVATTQLFAEAINARDRDEMARLRPILVVPDRPGDQPPGARLGSLLAVWRGVRRRSLRVSPTNTRVDVRSATTEIEHNYMLACALQARLLAGSAASGEIAQPELAGVVELALGHGVHSVAVAALWFVARYAVAVDRDSARRWLALGERISRELDTAPSLEEVLRDETMAALEITNLATLVAAAPAFDPTTALDQAAAWVASRSPSEIAPRDHVARISLT